MSELTKRFFQHLAKRCRADRNAGACLRRSLSFPPGEWHSAFPYVEPYISATGEGRRKMFYLAAGLWASAKEKNGTMPFGKALCEYMKWAQSESVEKRFIALLDADADQLPHRLHQMCVLLQDYPIDFPSLLDELLFWSARSKRTQLNWARDFYSDAADAVVAAGTPGSEDGEE